MLASKMPPTRSLHYVALLSYCLMVCPVRPSVTSRCSYEGERREHPSNCNSYYECLGSTMVEQRCKSGHYYRNATAQCEIDQGQCKPGECEEGSIAADPNEPTSYFQCLNGEVVSQKCPSGSYFNYMWEVCVVLRYGTFDFLLERCTEGDIQQDSDNCAGYWSCVNGELVNEQCLDGYYFDATQKKCLLDVRGHCTVASPSAETCLEDEVDEDSDDCAGYWKCIDREFVSLKCDGGSYFDLSSKKCIRNESELLCPIQFSK
ncbi:uncharacterized protein LOC115621704 [Scaptodrosophila lebanonensis]|uniref:Uncharacterized protein LOC115621704 n=1 Tax=Drosophila lebanonensis TaxID=7225 RepID=A0A6J2T8J9_DROLE|nr:uncharacterized protein LOC115621704 [Scaptodrosophila lebanonensis]